MKEDKRGRKNQVCACIQLPFRILDQRNTRITLWEGTPGARHVAPQIKTSKFFSPHLPTLILIVYSSFQRPLTLRWHGYLTTMRLPWEAPLWRITVVSSVLETSPLAYVSLLAIEDLFSGLHLSPAQARGIVLALLRLSNSPATVSEPTAGIPADDFEVLPPVSEAASDGLDHLLADDVILVTSRSPPFISALPVPARPLDRRAFAFDSPEVVAPAIAMPASMATTSPVTTTLDDESTYLNAAAAS
jgi:hypothetical protein